MSHVPEKVRNDMSIPLKLSVHIMISSPLICFMPFGFWSVLFQVWRVKSNCTWVALCQLVLLIISFWGSFCECY